MSDDEKILLLRIDVEDQRVTEVAKRMKRAKSTVSERRAKARRKLNEYMKKSTDQDFVKLVFRKFNSGVPPTLIVAEYGRPEEVKRLSELWKGFEEDYYWETIKVLKDYDAIEEPDTSVHEGLILRGVKKLTDWFDQAESERFDATEKLRQYERRYATSEELAVRIAVLKVEYGKLPKFVKEAISQKDIRKVAEKYTEKWRRDFVENMVKIDIQGFQMDELQKNLEFYRKRHGSNIKIGDVITNRTDFPGILHIVIGESEDGQSLIIDPFAKPKVRNFLATYKYKISAHARLLERQELPKALAIEKYEIVDIH